MPNELITGRKEGDPAVVPSEFHYEQIRAQKERDQFIEFIFKWVERGLFSQTTSAESALKIIAHHPSAPWYNPAWEWDVSHKEYAEKFYKEFPMARKCKEINDV